MAAMAFFLALAVLVTLLAQPGQALHAYGHASSRPRDFTDAQITAVADRFEMFTVEKGSAQDTYGQRSSIAATIGTAKRIKAVNADVKVLMYWNAAIHYDLYECESEVRPSWVIPGPSYLKRPHYNYSVPEFREWWVRCAVTAVASSGGMLSGLFLDATPQVADGQCFTEGDAALALWGTMVDQIRAKLGPDVVVIENGFWLAGRYPHTKQLAGIDAWKHAGTTYAESLANVGMDKSVDPEQDVAHLRWIANASSSAPSSLHMIGHGTINSDIIGRDSISSDMIPHGSIGSNASTVVSDAPSSLDPEFEFGLAKFLLVTRTVQDGWFLANTNYSIDGGLLRQPTAVYGTPGLGCGEPIAAFLRNGYILTRNFEHGHVTVDIRNRTASIDC